MSNNVISLVLGDWSHDGHSKSDTVNISSNLDKSQLEKAYKAGTKKVGFDLVNDVCSEYEDSKMPKEHWNKLVELGIDGEPIEDDEDLSIWTDEFVAIYLFIIKLGNEKFEGHILEEKDNPTIHIGGYGLYT